MLRPNWRLSTFPLVSLLTVVFALARNRPLIGALKKREEGETKRVLAFVLIASLVSGCAPIPSKSTTGEREYRYRSPGNVEEVDRKECLERAENKASSAASSLTFKAEDTVGRMFGLFGALAAVAAAMAHSRAIAEDAYEQEMKACLKEKGYDLPAND